MTRFEVITAAEPNAENFISTFFIFCSTSPSRMHISSRRATVAMHHSRPSKHFGCSWQASSLVSTAVDEELVVVLVFFALSLSATILQPSQRKILTRRPNTEGPDVTGATAGAKGVSTLLGTALSVSYGCATRESNTQIASCCGMLNTYQNKINLFIVITDTFTLIFCYFYASMPPHINFCMNLVSLSRLKSLLLWQIMAINLNLDSNGPCLHYQSTHATLT